jgi:hypothetical protein
MQKVSRTSAWEFENASAATMSAPKKLRQPAMREKRKLRSPATTTSFQPVPSRARRDAAARVPSAETRAKCATISTAGVSCR